MTDKEVVTIEVESGGVNLEPEFTGKTGIANTNFNFKEIPLETKFEKMRKAFIELFNKVGSLERNLTSGNDATFLISRINELEERVELLEKLVIRLANTEDCDIIKKKEESTQIITEEDSELAQQINENSGNNFHY